MSSFSGYGANLRYVFNRLSSFSRNRVKLPVVTPVTAGNNDTIIFEIPAGSTKIDLSTLTFHFTATTTATGGASPSVVIGRFTNALIAQLIVDINGVQVCNIDQYHHLYSLLMSYLGGDQSEFRNTSTEFSRNFTSSSTSTVMTNVPLCMKNFLGFLSANKILDLNLCGPLRVSMRIVPREALIITGSPTSTTFQMSNMFISYDSIQINDEMYDRLLYQRLQNGGVLPLVFQNFKTFLGGSGVVDQLTNRVPVNTNSLDMVMHTILPADYVTNGNTFNLGTSYHFKKGTVAGNTLTGCQFQLGSTQIPSFRPLAPIEMISHTYDSLGISQDLVGTSVTEFANQSASNNAGLSNNSLQDIYTQNFFLYAARLNNNNDPGEFAGKTISGIDTTGSSVLLTAQTFGTGSSNHIPLTVLMQSSILNIGANRQLQLIE